MSDEECKDYIVRREMLTSGDSSIDVDKHPLVWCSQQDNVYSVTFTDDSVGSVDDYINKIKGWHHDRNLIDGATDKDQFAKLIQEAGELSDSICKGKDVSDDIGDMMVVLINIAERNELTIAECLAKAWDDIKDRKGKMVDGVFVKEQDL